ncbi:MAG: hypothetical protein ACI9XO_000114 [Paraglaciecola sp.]|jgi:hypothetical protein
MRNFILLNAILEITVGILMVLAPELIPGMDASDPMAITLARMYGAAAIAIGFYAYKRWKAMPNPLAIKSFFSVLSIFHIGVANAAFWGYSSGISDFLAISILHLVLFMGSVYFMLKKTS